MKKQILTLLALSLFFVGFSQDAPASDHFNIAITPATSSTGDNTYNDQLTGIISSIFASKTRFSVVDQSGAQYIVSCNINSVFLNNINIPKQQLVKDQYTGKLVTQNYTVPGIDATVTVNIMVAEVSTASVKASKIINAAWRTEVDWSNTNLATTNAVNALSGFIRGWVNEVFPVDMKIIKIESFNKKGMPDKVLIKGGSDADLEHKKGSALSWYSSSSKLQVYENDQINVDGKVYDRPKKIGEVKVDEVQGDLTVCKVIDGADAIKREMDAGKTLLLKVLSY